MENTFSRRDDFSSKRMQAYTSFEDGILFDAPAMSPRSTDGVGTFFDAGT